MGLFFLHVCDPAGQMLSRRRVEAHDVNGALAEANRRACAIAATPDTPRPGRIDVADGEGRTLARLVWSEVAAAIG